MGSSMRRICSISARGGSKGLPSKNIRPLLGTPLIAVTVQQALASEMFDHVAVSSDSAEIRRIAMEAGATLEIVRPDHLASDTADKASATLRCVTEAECQTGMRFDTMVDLDATAPMRLPEHIRGAVALCELGGCTNVFSACPSRRSPYFNLVEETPDGFAELSKPLDVPVVRRQDVPRAFDMNASIYVWPRETFFSRQAAEFMDKTRIYEMPEYSMFDIDSALDLELVEFLYPRHIGGDAT